MFRSWFPWFQSHPNKIYFDHAATTLKPIWLQKINDQKFSNQQIKNGFDQTNLLLSQFLGCGFQNCFYTSGATYVINFLAYFLADQIGPGDQIILTHFEHSSNLLPWMRLAKKQKAKLVYAKNQHNNQPIICEQDIINLVNSQTKIVSFANKTNLTGQTLDLSLLSSKIKAINPNCLIIVDATQYFASNKLSCAQSGADFIFGSAHKLYGPYGIGFCYVANQHLLAIKGEKWNQWIVHDQNYLTHYRNLDFASLVNFAFSLSFLEENYQTIKQQEKQLVNHWINFWPKNTSFRYLKINQESNLFLVQHQTISSYEIARYLDHHGVIVRAGWSCAYLAPKILVNGDYFRVSLSFLNETREIDRFIQFLTTFNLSQDLFY